MYIIVHLLRRLRFGDSTSSLRSAHAGRVHYILTSNFQVIHRTQRDNEDIGVLPASVRRTTQFDHQMKILLAIRISDWIPLFTSP